MALDVINGGTNVIANVTNWYAYNATELFLPTNGGTFTINLGTAQDDVTHIASLPMRVDLLSCTGDGLDLSFAAVGDGQVQIDLGQSRWHHACCHRSHDHEPGRKYARSLLDRIRRTRCLCLVPTLCHQSLFLGR